VKLKGSALIKPFSASISVFQSYNSFELLSFTYEIQKRII